MKRLVLVLAAVVAAVALLSGCGSLTPYAATVNGERISQRQLDGELRAIRANKRYLDGLEQSQFPVRGSGKDTFDSAFVARVLTRRILLELIHQEVERRHITVAAADLNRARADVEANFQQDPKVLPAFGSDYRQDLVRRTAEVNVLQAALGKVKVDDATVQRFYEEHKQEFEQTCVSHILVDTQDAAGAIKARIDAGEDFAAIAKAESKDPGSAPNGGSLGCVNPGSFVPEFEDAMNKLQPGQVSGVVQTQFGFHVLEVTDRRPQALSEVQDRIRQQLLGEAQGDLNAFIDKALRTAKISVNPRYGHFVRSNGRAEVVPPEAPITTTTTPAPLSPIPAPQPTPTTAAPGG